MAELTSRPYRRGDGPALTALYNAVEKYGGGHPGYTVDETEAVIASTIADPESDSRLVFAPDGELVAAGVASTPPPGGFRIDAPGGVAPHWRRRGLGRELLTWQINRGREIHRAAGSPGNWVLEVTALLGDDAGRLFDRFGFTSTRYYFEMVAPTGVGPRPVPDGLKVVAYEPHLEKAVYDAHVEAFSDHYGYQVRELDNWAGFTVRSDSFRPDLSRLAFDGEELAAYLLGYDDADPDRVYIGQVGTRRPWRRRGLAGALLADVLSAAATAGKGHAYLGVDADSPTGAVGVYEGVGFTIATRAAEYRMNL